MLIIANMLSNNWRDDSTMDITRWSISKSDWLCFFAVKDGETLYSQQKQELELIFTKFMLKLKKVGKITKSFRYGLNQIPYDYILEVMNRFKGLDVIDRVPEALWTEVCNIVQEVVTKEIEMPHSLVSL